MPEPSIESKKLHWALRPAANVWILIVQGSFAAAILNFVAPTIWPVFVVAACLGVVGGILQTMAFREHSKEIVAVSSMKELQQVWRKTKLGRRSFIFRQVALAAYFVLNIYYGTAQSIAGGYHGPLAMILGYVGCDLTFMFAREMVTLKAIWNLQANNQDSINRG